MAMSQAYKQMFAKSTLNRVLWTAKARPNTFLAAPGSQPPKGWVVLWGRAPSGWALLALGQTLQRWAVLPGEPSTSDLDPTPTRRTPTRRPRTDSPSRATHRTWTRRQCVANRHQAPVPTPLPSQLARHRPDANTSHTATRPPYRLPFQANSQDIAPTPTRRTPTPGPVPTPLPGHLTGHGPDANALHCDR
jgi:hypothetical protein